MSNRDYAYRRWKRHVKGMRRLRQDRAQHGGVPTYTYYSRVEEQMVCRLTCECFSDEAGKGRGKEFAFFADTPIPLPQIWKKWESGPSGVTRQEFRAMEAAKVEDE